MFRLSTPCYFHGIQIVVLVDGNPTALNQSVTLSRLALFDMAQSQSISLLECSFNSKLIVSFESRNNLRPNGLGGDAKREVPCRTI